MKAVYDHRQIEASWARRWEQERTHVVDLDHARRPFYNLMMFPYPSAEGLHVGNVFAFVGSDIQGRYHAARGYDVFEPMGFDAFGMHSENFAIRTGAHPREMVPRNIGRFRELQLKRIGNRFDWSHEVDTTDPAYYRWTQWLFLRMHRRGLAYRAGADVNWCPSCRTVLADEQAEGGVCERCDTPVKKRRTEQWFLRITAYAERLLRGLDALDWSEVTKSAQRRWIGRSEGALIRFQVRGSGTALEVFTTRPDTLWGVTFLALAPEHPALATIVAPEARSVVDAYCAAARKAAMVSSRGVERPKTGAFTGAFATHVATGRETPIWVADYVGMDYGTGAVMGVPAHDQRDLDFAHACGLGVVPVVRSSRGDPAADPAGAFEGEGVLVSSGPFSGRESAEARRRITAWLAERGVGGADVRYHLHDWCVSRQRYWGPPIPMVRCERCGEVPVPEEELPVVLPYVERFEPDGSGVSPLARCTSFVQTSCPHCGGPARRETDVSDNFLDSAWYFLRYPSTEFADRAFDAGRTRRWLPVARYVGGNEHAVLHLLYTRFVTMALHDMGLLDFEEPFTVFRAHGLIVRDGAKMSKSRGNVVNPDAYLDRYGADVFRTYLMFAGDYGTGGDFRDDNISGIERFLGRLWRYVTGTPWDDGSAADPALERLVRGTVRRVTADIERLHYNTAIAACMELLGALQVGSVHARSQAAVLLRLLEPFAPFVTHELWERMGGERMLCREGWPEGGEPAGSAAEGGEVIVVIQIDGKLRDTMAMSRGAAEVEVVVAAMGRERVRRHLEGKSVLRTVLVPDKLLNIVTGQDPEGADRATRNPSMGSRIVGR